MKRKNWTYDSAVGWRLDGTDIVLDREPYGGSHAYTARGGGYQAEPIDRYLTEAMRFIEKETRP